MENKNIIAIKQLSFPWETFDPFLFCAHHKDKYPEGDKSMGLSKPNLVGRNIGNDFTIKDGFRMYHGAHVPGFPVHPHRGFETITINKQGFVDHSDSLGAAGRFGAGDVQWMTAGKGVQHAEMFPMINDDEDNMLEIFQVWLNLPRASKFVEPYFKMLWKDMIPTIKERDEEGKTTEINLVSGSLNGVSAPEPTPDSWASNPENGVLILTIKMEANAIWRVPKSDVKDVSRTLYFYRGDSLIVDEQEVGNYHLIQVNPNEEIVLQNGNSEGLLLMLQGKPIGEPVVQYGPFVMNTMQEIKETFIDYQKTQFGGWPWPSHDYVHDKAKGRFALHADGKEEVK